MRKELIILLLGVGILAGCRPKTVLSPRQMEDLLVDLHTAEGVLQESGYNYGHDEAYRGYSLVILSHYGLTKERWDSTLMWYTAHPSVFDKIYPKVMERLQAQYDSYKCFLDTYRQNPIKTVDDWLFFCQHGYKIELIEEKEKKSDPKFAYVKNLL